MVQWIVLFHLKGTWSFERKMEEGSIIRMLLTNLKFCGNFGEQPPLLFYQLCLLARSIVYIINTIYTSTYIYIYICFLAIQLQKECNYIINLENNISWYSFELQFAPYNIVIPAYRSPKKKTWGSDCCLQDFKAPEISKEQGWWLHLSHEKPLFFWVI